MTTELEELLRAGMDRFTASAPVPVGLAGKAIRHRARRQAAIRAFAATGTAAVAVVVGVAMAGLTGSTRTTGVSPTQAASPPGRSVVPSSRRAASAAELVVYATAAAAAAPAFDPKPYQWIYTETLTADSSAGGGGFLFGPPDQRRTTRSWMRADHLRWADVEHGRVVVSPVVGANNRYPPAQRKVFQRVAELGGVGGWPNSSYPYLDSLPADPVQLKAIIAANVKADYSITGYGDTGIFNAITGLMETVVLPPRLYAALYGVLAKLHGVRFDSATDLAGRRGLGLYRIQEGYFKDEIVINPKTYAYMGYEDVAIRAHASVATDGTRHIRKGQVLGWQAMIQSGIVDRPGQLP